jgi:hypothetical protein
MTVILAAVFGIGAFLPFTLYAAPAHTVAPLVIDIEAEARDIITRQITVTNTGTQPLTVYPSVNNISLDEGGTIEKFLPPVMSDRTASLASWIEIRRGGIKVSVGESVTVDMTLRVNPTPVSGEYHALISFGNGNNADIAAEQVKLGRAPGVIITVTIDDKRQEFLKLSRFIVDRFITKGGNQAAKYTITNPGDEPLVPTGEIIFYDSKGREIASLEVNDQLEQIAPKEEKEFIAEVPSNGLFGKYKAFLNVEYGSQLASVQDTAFFYVFPLKTVLILFGIIATIVIILSLYIHKRYLADSFDDDSDFVPLHVRVIQSEPKEHDIDLKQVLKKEVKRAKTVRKRKKK